MQTEKLYKQNSYLTECEATVTEIREAPSGQAIILDRTVFFPASGGQPADAGSITPKGRPGPVTITDVHEKSGEVLHFAERHGLNPGDAVDCAIDWNRRFDHMQRHCGEHILSGAFFREFGGVNRGFRMGDEYMTIDISLEEDPEITEITWDMAMLAERRANEVIRSNTPVTTRLFDSRDELDGLPLRKVTAAEEDISIVCIGDASDPADCVACCGTHPDSAGQAGLVKIYRVERYKGMFRVFFEAGERALADYRRKHDIVTALSHRYSTGAKELLEKIAAREDKAKALKEDLIALKQVVIGERVAEIEDELKTSERGRIITKEFHPALDADDILRAGRPFCESPGMDKLLLIVSPGDNTVFLFSNGKNHDCGKLVKENAPIYGGKGGGNATSARALFKTREYLDTFIDLLEKHLRA